MYLTKADLERILDQKLDQKLAIHTMEIKTFVVEHVEKKIDELAATVKKGFDDVDRRLDSRALPRYSAGKNL